MVKSIKDVQNESLRYLTMAYLHHNNIVNLISVSLEGNDNRISSLVLFMEYCEDGDLSELINARKSNIKTWTQEELMACLDQLITGFVYLQNNGIAHRNVVPQNILVENNSRTFKIGGFGCSCMVTREDDTIIGTPSYLSPLLKKAYRDCCYSAEATLKHNPYKSDVYSLGIVLLYMTTGQIEESLKQLDDLQNNINRIIFEISDDYPKIKLLLSHMLEVEETNRPDFLELKKLFNEVRYRDLMTDCRSCRASKPREQFRNFEEESICDECIINSNSYAGSVMLLRCDNCGELNNQTLVKVVESQCFCYKCIDRLILYPEFEL